jgi:hypothetical protein
VYHTPPDLAGLIELRDANLHAEDNKDGDQPVKATVAQHPTFRTLDICRC